MNISKMLKFPKTICHHSAKISCNRPKILHQKNKCRRLMWDFEARSFTQKGLVAIITTFMDNKELCP
jgi:hypothetical protein